MKIFFREKVRFMAPILVLYGNIAGDRTLPQLEMSSNLCATCRGGRSCVCLENKQSP